LENVHSRVFQASIDAVRPWIEACWSGTERDAFPRDVIASWRKNPAGVDPGALLPGQTLLGHGLFRFRLRAWDGARWRVDIVGGPQGWHGFDLEEVEGGCRVTHTLQMELSGKNRVMVPLAIEPIHDWAVEAAFDRLEEALRTGRVPERTARPMPLRAAIPFQLLRAVYGRRSARRAGGPAQAAAA
jgi:hypothetical protein